MSSCRSCSAEVPKDSAFCPSCGVKLELSATPVSGSAEPSLGESSAPLAPTFVSAESATVSAGAIERFLPGAMLADRFRIVGMLGVGGMGEVYRAQDTRLGQTVALKFLPAALTNDEQRLANLRNEVRLARQVSHPNVCRVYDITETDGLHFLSMEFVDGEDLATLLHRIGRLPVNKGMQIARELCAGLAAAHDKGVLHRDLKPGNIMLDGSGRIRITDFGLARRVDDATELRELAGTPAYMAPEQMQRGETTVQSDLYSLGLVFYEIFTGTRPFAADSMADLQAAHVEQTPPAPTTLVAELDPSMEQAILSCLQKDPLERPASAAALIGTLPGHDPLAAALAAGQTPSPQLVAAAGEVGTLRPAAAISCLAAVLGGLLIFAVVSNAANVQTQIDQMKPPAALQHIAESVLTDAGYYDAEHPPRDRAIGFETADAPVRRPRIDGRAPPLGKADVFWYRQGPRFLTPISASERNATLSLWTRGRIRIDDPPSIQPGMVTVMLSMQGSLLQLVAIPKQTEDEPDSSAQPQWRPLFAAAGLEYDAFERLSATFTPPVFADQSASWSGGNKDDAGGQPVQIQTASADGKPVFFRVETAEVDAVDSRPAYQEFGVQLAQSIYVVITLAALILAARNLRSGRVDRKGAARFAGYVFVVSLLIWVFEASHRPSILHEFPLMTFAIAVALEEAVRFTVMYAALEPYIRRNWPESLIAWNRVFRRRFGDPLVGQHILIGALFGVFWLLLIAAARLAPDQLWQSPDAIRLSQLLGTRHLVAEFFVSQIEAVGAALAVVVLYLLCLFICRRSWFAAGLLFVIWTAIFGTVDNAALLGWFGVGLRVASLIFLLIRYGLLATCVAYFCTFFLSHCAITTDLSAWYAGNSILALSLIAGLACFGTYASLGMVDRRAKTGSLPS